MESRREKAGGYERLRSWVALGELFRGVWSNDRIGMDVQGGQRRNSVQPESLKTLTLSCKTSLVISNGYSGLSVTSPPTT